MRRRSRNLAGVLLAALFPTLMLLPSAAVAADSYQASVVVSIAVTAESPIVVGDDSAVVATVSSDSSQRSSDSRGLGGQVRFHIDGKQILTTPLDADNRVEMTVPAVELPEGEHTLRATYLPPSDSNLKRASDTAPILVVDCVDDCPQAAEVPQDGGGLLPNTGGFWLGLLVIALLALGAGTILVRRSHHHI